MSVFAVVPGGKANHSRISEFQPSGFLLQSLITEDPNLRSPGGVPGQ